MPWRSRLEKQRIPNARTFSSPPRERQKNAAGTLELGTKTDEDGITAITASSSSIKATGTVSLSAVATDEAIVKELAALGYYEYALAYSSWSLKIDIAAFSESLADALSSLNLWSVVSYEESTEILSIYVGAIPEPNLFGIFAGISAISLTAMRRRKRRSRE